MKSLVRYRPVTCKSALHPVRGLFPHHWDLNVYRGCQHGCKYCYALYSHKYLKQENDESDQINQTNQIDQINQTNQIDQINQIGRIEQINQTDSDKNESLAGNYYNHIYAKTNIVERLEKELSRPGRKPEVINLGGVSDSYQQAEAEYALMPDILKLMIKYKNPVNISTKSALILRDFDLFDELSKVSYVNIAATVTTTDESLRKIIEPDCSASAKRFDFLEKFKKTDATVGVHVMPVMPLISDSLENLEPIFSRTREIGADYIIAAPLFLRGQTRKSYFEFVKNDFPHLYDPMRILYKTGHLNKEYKTGIYEKINSLSEKYNLSDDYRKSMNLKLKKVWRDRDAETPQEKKPKQLTLSQFGATPF
ncbi:hypothetical protein MsAg5_03740 [Methanosarcinaceae archaeon Ag5]|uniref:Elp3/MiaA/NifB-like radical SAM core domain-containing protein n=1 Tax=Methanolapillus africanus TaxID=3028297 RepID=A0AAE4MH60_9EURY|nr:hypothetical protein [Methanosarcinaceae archaeon Ag5]